MFRENLYRIDNVYITLFAETVPNLIPSLLFTLIGVFYIVPLFFKQVDLINKPIFIWSINALNLIIFSSIEYLHVVLNLGTWDNNDIFASLVGITVSTIIYYKFKNIFINKI